MNYNGITVFFQNIFILRRPRVVNFADIIQIATVFIKTTYKDSKKYKRFRNCLKMQSTSVFVNITKVADFHWKNADDSRVQGVRYVIYIFLDLLSVKYNCAKFHHCRICVTDFRKGVFLARPSVWATPKRPILNRIR